MERESITIVFGLFGAGGFAREIMPIAMERLRAMAGDRKISAYFVDENPTSAQMNSLPVISEKTFFSIAATEKYFNIAIGESKTRQTISERCFALKIKPLTLMSNQAIIYDENSIGDGAILCANTIVTSNATIGQFFHSNIYSYVAHDCVIGDFVTFAPGVHCNGNVHIKNHAYIGTGAILKQGTVAKPLVIGEGAIVGMGAVVTKDVPPYSTVVGNPAKPLIKQ